MTATINASTSSGVVTSADTSGVLALQSNGTTKLTVDSTGAYGQIISGTAVASTSGTSIDFTGIPSWVKRITVMLNGVSTNGTSNPLIQIGSGSVQTTGYLSQSYLAATGGVVYTTGFGLDSGAASNLFYGHVILTLISGSTWVSSHSFGLSQAGAGYSGAGGGNVTLGGTLDRLRFTTVNGTDTFDAGSINILYEG